MSSNINPNNINGNFPVAGQDNDSQGFRDNFTNILNNFSFASSEVTDLQNSINNIRLYVATNGNVSPYYANVAQSLTVNKTSSLVGDVLASANVTIAGNLIVTGNIYETGTITINQQEIVAGNITTSGNIVTNNITTLAGTNGNLSLDPDGGGWITANGNIRVSGNISNVAGLQAVAIGNVTPGSGAFTTGSFTSNVTLANLLVNTNGAVTGALNVTGNIVAGNISTPAGGLITATVLGANGITITGNVNANGGNIVTTASTVSLFNSTATTVSAFGAATTVNIGNTNGNTNISGNATVSGTASITGNTSITGNATIGGTASITGNTSITGNATIGGTASITGNVNANGGNIVTTSSNVLLFNTTATTVNAFGDATTINIGNTSGNTNINGFLTVSSAIQFANLTTTQINAITPTNRGMTVFNFTTGNVQVYNGTKWANITLS
jgi:predicted acyltransferase (DUF342 family)